MRKEDAPSYRCAFPLPATNPFCTMARVYVLLLQVCVFCCCSSFLFFVAFFFFCAFACRCQPTTTGPYHRMFQVSGILLDCYPSSTYKNAKATEKGISVWRKNGLGKTPPGHGELCESHMKKPPKTGIIRKKTAHTYSHYYLPKKPQPNRTPIVNYVLLHFSTTCAVCQYTTGQAFEFLKRYTILRETARDGKACSDRLKELFEGKRG